MFSQVAGRSVLCVTWLLEGWGPATSQRRDRAVFGGCRAKVLRQAVMPSCPQDARIGPGCPESTGAGASSRQMSAVLTRGGLSPSWHVAAPRLAAHLASLLPLPPGLGRIPR